MEQYRLKLLIEPNDIYNRLSPEDKERFKEVKIINATLLHDGSVELECLVLENSIINCISHQRLLSNDGYLKVN